MKGSCKSICHFWNAFMILQIWTMMLTMMLVSLITCEIICETRNVALYCHTFKYLLELCFSGRNNKFFSIGHLQSYERTLKVLVHTIALFNWVRGLGSTAKKQYVQGEALIENEVLDTHESFTLAQIVLFFYMNF